MRNEERKQFGSLLAETFAGYGRPLPEDPVLLQAWWDKLAMFPLQIVAQALTMHCDTEARYAPTPVQIAALCKTMDGRPGADDAWSLALLSHDENNTVVWTQETAEAFFAARAVLEKGDEVGARMAFKDRYNKLVQIARAHLKPAKWIVSPGRDKNQASVAVKEAVELGRLPNESAAPLLLGHSTDGEEVSASGLAQLKELMATLTQKKIDSVEAEKQAEREAVAKRKAELNKQFEEHFGKQDL